MERPPALGLYDQLLTEHLAEQVERWREARYRVGVSQVDEAEVAHLLGRFVGEAAARALAVVRGTDGLNDPG